MNSRAEKLNLRTASPEEKEARKIKGRARRIVEKSQRRGGCKDPCAIASTEFAPQTVRHLKEQGTV